MSSYKADYRGVGEMLRAPFLQAEMRRRAELVAVRARTSAPVDRTGPHPGRYRDSFTVESGVRRGKSSRAYGRVVNSSPEARWVEYGSRNNPRYRTMGRALDAARG